MTDQEVFNSIWQYFIVEKHPQSLSEESGKCVYYDKATGNRCAIGCLFPKDIAKNIHNAYGSTSINYILNMYCTEDDPCKDVLKYLTGVDQSLLRALQNAHDRNFGSFKSLEYRLTEIAREYSLAIPSTQATQED